MNYFETSDYNLAASLGTLGYKLPLVDKSNPDRVTFCFQRDAGIDKAVQLFWAGDLRLEPKHFHHNQKILKSRIKNG